MFKSFAIILILVVLFALSPSLTQSQTTKFGDYKNKEITTHSINQDNKLALEDTAKDDSIITPELVLDKIQPFYFPDSENTKPTKSLVYYLNAFVDAWHKDHTILIDVVGYSDNQGSFEVNEARAKERTKLAVDYPVSKGIPRFNIFDRVGGSRNTGENQFKREGRQRSRRVDISIRKPFDSKKAPESFRVLFETTQGAFEVTAERNLSPLAVDRFYKLVKSNYFTNIPIYRVMKNFVAQFGTVNGFLDSSWSKEIIPDEPVKRSNHTGTIAFARAGKDTRGTQLFINLKHNSKLDTVSYGETLGFPPFAYISKGMDVVYKFYDGYGDEPRLKMDTITGDVGEFLKKNYPKLDYILKASIKLE